MKKIIDSIAIHKSKINNAALLALSLSLAALAQYTLYLSYADGSEYWNVSQWVERIGNNTTPLPGLLLYALAGLLWILSLRSLRETLPPMAELWHGTYPVLPPRFGFWLTAFGLAVLTALYTSQPNSAWSNGYGLAFVWILSLALFIYSVLRQSDWHALGLENLRVWLIHNRIELAFVLCLLLFAIAVRTYELEIHPYSMINDEGKMGQGALCLLSGKCRNIFAIGWASQPYTAYLPYAFTVGLLGNDHALPIRLVSVTTGTLAVLFTYLFCREMFGKQIALGAGIILAALPYHIHFSRLGIDNVVDSLSSALILWLMIRALRTGSARFYLLVGIVSGLCLYTYPGSRLAPALGMLLFGAAALTQRGLFRAQWRNLVIFLTAALLTIAPIFGTYQQNSEFNQRLNSVGLLQENRLQQEMEISGLNAVQVIIAQFFKSIMPFIVSSGALNFFNSPRPYFTPLMAVFLMLGLAIAAWRLGDLRLLTLLAWFLAPIVFGSTLTVGPPSHQRMLGSAPAAAILATLGLVTIAQALGNLNQRMRRLSSALLVGVLLFTAYQNVAFYFGEYRTSRLFEDLSNEITYESRTLIRSLKDQGQLLLIGEPMTRVEFGNFGYFNPDVKKYDFNQITPQALASLPKDQDALFLAIPYREPDLRLIAQWLPGGTWIAERRRNQPDLPLYFAYKVSKEQLQSYQP